MKISQIFLVLLTITKLSSLAEQAPSTICSVLFEGLDSVPLSVNEISLNTFHVRYPSLNHLRHKNRGFWSQRGDEDSTTLQPPLAIFQCTSTQFLKFDISTVEANHHVKIERRRLIPVKYNPLTPTDDIRHSLRLEVPLQTNATGQYTFFSKSSLFNESFFVFAQLDSTKLLGTGRRLKSHRVDANTTVIPCISPNPVSPMSLWAFDPDHETFDKVWLDGNYVTYDPKMGFVLTAKPTTETDGLSSYYRCTTEQVWYAPPVVDVDLDFSPLHIPDLTIFLNRNDAAECYGIPGSHVKLSEYHSTQEEAPELFKCLEQRKPSCGEPTETGITVEPDVNGASPISLVHFVDDSGLLVCNSESETVSTWFFRGLDRKYYREQQLETIPIDLLIGVDLVPNPGKAALISGSVLTATVLTVSGVVLKTPSLLFVKYRNGTISLIHDLLTPKSFIVTSDMEGIYVDELLIHSGKPVLVYVPFTVENRTCDDNQFQCETGECIPVVKLCDHRIHCRDGRSDEINCQQFRRNCTRDEFQCHTGQCIRASFRCSGKAECFDASDESGDCIQCAPNEFRCNNGMCIKNSQVCDSEIDCRDGSDETWGLCKNCNNDPERFRCWKGDCISTKRLCDGIFHCQDGSDEALDVCSKDVIPEIVNDQSVYEFEWKSNGYLVCEVVIPALYAAQNRFQPKVNWTYVEAQVTTEIHRHPTKNVQPLKKLKQPINNLASNLSTYYFAYKFDQFDVRHEGMYRCTAYNEGGSHSKELVARLTHHECVGESTIPTSERPEHPPRPETNPQTRFQCKAAGKFRDTDNCSMFHDCVPRRNQSQREGYDHYEIICAPGTVFCPIEQYCGWIKDCPCDIR